MRTISTICNPQPLTLTTRTLCTLILYTDHHRTCAMFDLVWVLGSEDPEACAHDFVDLHPTMLTLTTLTLAILTARVQHVAWVGSRS